LAAYNRGNTGSMGYRDPRIKSGYSPRIHPAEGPPSMTLIMVLAKPRAVISLSMVDDIAVSGITPTKMYVFLELYRVRL